MNTGKKIKLIRTFRGLTQKELGEACGIHEVAIRKYELGKNLPKSEQLRKIAEALNVNVNALAEFDIEADGDVIPLLFAIDEVFDISLKDVDGELLLVSQFTLYASCRKGNRPSFTQAGDPKKAEELYEYIIKECNKEIDVVQTGIFGAHMEVALINDGPFTVVLEDL